MTRLYLVWLLLLAALLPAGCSSTYYSGKETGMFRSPEYYETFGPGSMQPPDYGYPFVW